MDAGWQPDWIKKQTRREGRLYLIETTLRELKATAASHPELREHQGAIDAAVQALHQLRYDPYPLPDRLDRILSDLATDLSRHVERSLHEKDEEEQGRVSDLFARLSQTGLPSDRASASELGRWLHGHRYAVTDDELQDKLRQLETLGGMKRASSPDSMRGEQ